MDPATTSQVQAYRFVLRRMESALIRKDAVMLHEPQRHHLRATVVGVVLGVLVLVAAMVFGRFNPTSDLSASEIVIGDPSESVFVVSGALVRAPCDRLAESATMAFEDLGDQYGQAQQG